MAAPGNPIQQVWFQFAVVWALGSFLMTPRNFFLPNFLLCHWTTLLGLNWSVSKLKPAHWPDVCDHWISTVFFSSPRLNQNTRRWCHVWPRADVASCQSPSIHHHDMPFAPLDRNGQGFQGPSFKGRVVSKEVSFGSDLIAGRCTG